MTETYSIVVHLYMECSRWIHMRTKCCQSLEEIHPNLHCKAFTKHGCGLTMFVSSNLKSLETKCLANAHKSTFVHLYIITLFEWYLTCTRITEKPKSKSKDSTIMNHQHFLTFDRCTTNHHESYPNLSPFKMATFPSRGDPQVCSWPWRLVQTTWDVWNSLAPPVVGQRGPRRLVCLGWKNPHHRKGRTSLFINRPVLYMTICMYIYMYIFDSIVESKGWPLRSSSLGNV